MCIVRNNRTTDDAGLGGHQRNSTGVIHYRGFLRIEDRARVVATPDMESLLAAMEAWHAPANLKFTLAKRVI